MSNKMAKIAATKAQNKPQIGIRTNMGQHIVVSRLFSSTKFTCHDNILNLRDYHDSYGMLHRPCNAIFVCLLRKFHLRA